MKNSDMPAMPTALEIDELDCIGVIGIDQCLKFNTGLTKREQACITLGIPESGDPELDELILKSERKRVAAQVLCGYMANTDSNIALWQQDTRTTIKCILSNADALLEELSK